MMKLFLRTVIVVGVLAAIGTIASQVSPWPSALLIRFTFDRGGNAASAALEKHVPDRITEQLNLQYDRTDSDAFVDVFYPADVDKTDRALLTVIWIHGGGWISGNKDQIANYARILAGRGFTVVGVDYSIAPGSTYPTPLRQVNAALAYLQENAAKLHIDPQRFVLAGDSAGAHIAAQMANIISVPSYAQAVGIAPSIKRTQMAGLVLYCGAYKLGEEPGIRIGDFSRVLLWAYSGRKDFGSDPSFATASVIDYVTVDFPPVFISAGNADPLQPQSLAFSAALGKLGIRVDSLFFPADYQPPLPHEYQFNLDTEAGQLTLERSLVFLNSL